MSDKTGVEWADATWNIVVGCRPKSTGCDNCYAQRTARRMAGIGVPCYAAVLESKMKDNKRHFLAKWNGNVAVQEGHWGKPLGWKKPRIIFPCATGDLFYERVPGRVVDAVLGTLCACPQHTGMVLTKRPDRMAEYMKALGNRDTAGKQLAGEIQLRFGDPVLAKRILRAIHEDGPPDQCVGWPPRNIWGGATTENQATANWRIPFVLDAPFAHRFISVEPFLNQLHVHEHLGPGKIEWVVAGGESGPNARPCHPSWVGILRECATSAGAGFCFKQWGAWLPANQGGPRDLDIDPEAVWLSITGQVNRDAPMSKLHDVRVYRVGKKRAGRSLWGTVWAQAPGEGLPEAGSPSDFLNDGVGIPYQAKEGGADK